MLWKVASSVQINCCGCMAPGQMAWPSFAYCRMCDGFFFISILIYVVRFLFYCFAFEMQLLLQVVSYISRYPCVVIEVLLHMLYYNNLLESFRYLWRSVAESQDKDPLSLGTDEVSGEEC